MRKLENLLWTEPAIWRDPGLSVFSKLSLLDPLRDSNSTGCVRTEGDMVVIGLNHRRNWICFFGVVMLLFFIAVALARWGAGEATLVSVNTLTLLIFGPWTIPLVLMFIKPEGPDLVAMANGSGALFLWRSRITATPQKLRTFWRTSKLEIRLTRWEGTDRAFLTVAERSHGRLSVVYQRQVDRHILGGWEDFIRSVNVTAPGSIAVTHGSVEFGDGP